MPGGRTPPKTAAAADAPPICTCQSYKGITLASRLFPWNNLLWELLKLNKYVESTWFCSGAIVTESSEIDMHLIWIHTKLWWTSSLLVEAWSKNMLCCKSANLSKQIGNTHFTSFNLWTAKTIWVVRLWQATRHTRSRSCWLQHVVMIATLPKKWWLQQGTSLLDACAQGHIWGKITPHYLNEAAIGTNTDCLQAVHGPNCIKTKLPSSYNKLHQHCSSVCSPLYCCCQDWLAVIAQKASLHLCNLCKTKALTH